MSSFLTDPDGSGAKIVPNLKFLSALIDLEFGG
jgi:hypothetical protein